jgi:hypothetical protein
MCYIITQNGTAVSTGWPTARNITTALRIIPEDLDMGAANLNVPPDEEHGDVTPAAIAAAPAATPTATPTTTTTTITTTTTPAEATAGAGAAFEAGDAGACEADGSVASSTSGD